LRKFIEITEKKPATVVDATNQTEQANTTEVADTQNTEQTTPTGGANTPETSEQTPQVTETTSNTTTDNTETNQETTDNDTNTATETNRIIGGSRHSNIDWNSRLGVPQYRTQSDNLSVPEATCNVTTMAMTLERLGNSRSDVVAAIEVKLKEGIENPDMKALWESKSKEYLEKITSYEKSLEADAKAKEDAAEISKTEAEEEIKTAEGDDLIAANEKLDNANKILNNKRKKATYRYLRGNKGDLVGKEEELSKIYRENAQMEDLIDFYLYLTTSKVNQRTAIFSTYTDQLPEQIKNPEYTSTSTGQVKTERIELNGEKISNEQRNKIKIALDNGCSVVISIFHKGKGAGSHIVSIQSISSEGLILDDPYGELVDSYRHGEVGDLYGGKDKKRDSANKNTVHSDSKITDYTKRDFTPEAAQNLEDDESKGKSKTLKWEMINESKKYAGRNLIYYIIIYENN
jgi:hypothetical protein